jgi:tetratricopeptide (TPR) repeat protein
MMLRVRSSVVLFAGWVSFSAYAVEAYKPTDAEVNSLPPFCAARYKGSESPEYKLWERSLGPDFQHTHHYCDGLNLLNRYYRSRSEQSKRFNLGSALGNFDYMVSHANPGYSLMPDVYLNRGVTYSLMKNAAKAVTDMNKALEMNPQLVKAYNVLADYYVGIKQERKALEIVSTGLQHNPGMKGLQRRYRDLGGKLPYPDAIQPKPAELAGPAANDPTPVPTTPAVASEPAPTPVIAPAEPIAQPKIGSPKNPYCRFCPD